MKLFEFCLRFHRSLFPRVQSTIFHNWSRWWLGADQPTSHYLRQWRLDYRRICASANMKMAAIQRRSLLNENCYILIQLSPTSVPRVQLAISQHRFKYWLGTNTSRLLNEWWPILQTHICVTQPRWIKMREFIYHISFLRDHCLFILYCFFNLHLRHWEWMTHICADNLTTIGSDNGYAPGEYQAVI